MRFLFVIFFFLSSKSFCADTTLIAKHFENILNTKEARSYDNIESLNQVAAYIYSVFSLYGDSTVYQNFEVDGATYKNVITSFGPVDAPRIIVGAHYDVCGDQDGADDNASGVVGLLEFARMLDESKLKYRVDLVAYSLEEPPFFGTNEMGSYIHANYLNDNSIDVYGMICLDMIGYFSDEPKSQTYPLGILKLIYGSKGDYITCVQKFHGGKFAGQAKRNLKKSETTVEIKSFKGPANLRGIALSDHLNYWRFGYSALFITNTGFFRNPNYHKESDKINTLDIPKMAATIDAVCNLLIMM